jgi:hypothetical protein
MTAALKCPSGPTRGFPGNILHRSRFKEDNGDRISCIPYGERRRRSICCFKTGVSSRADTGTTTPLKLCRGGLKRPYLLNVSPRKERFEKISYVAILSKFCNDQVCFPMVLTTLIGSFRRRHYILQLRCRDEAFFCSYILQRGDHEHTRSRQNAPRGSLVAA